MVLCILPTICVYGFHRTHRTKRHYFSISTLSSPLVTTLYVSPGSTFRYSTFYLQSLFMFLWFSQKIIAIFLLLFFFSCSVSFLILFLVSLAPKGLNILSFHNWRESMLSLGQELNFWVIFKRATCHKFLNVFIRFYFKMYYIFVEKGPAAETTEAPQP